MTTPTTAIIAMDNVSKIYGGSDGAVTAQPPARGVARNGRAR